MGFIKRKDVNDDETFDEGFIEEEVPEVPVKRSSKSRKKVTKIPESPNQGKISKKGKEIIIGIVILIGVLIITSGGSPFNSTKNNITMNTTENNNNNENNIININDSSSNTISVTKVLYAQNVKLTRCNIYTIGNVLIYGQVRTTIPNYDYSVIVKSIMNDDMKVTDTNVDPSTNELVINFEPKDLVTTPFIVVFFKSVTGKVEYLVCDNPNVIKTRVLMLTKDIDKSIDVSNNYMIMTIPVSVITNDSSIILMKEFVNGLRMYVDSKVKVKVYEVVPNDKGLLDEKYYTDYTITAFDYKDNKVKLKLVPEKRLMSNIYKIEVDIDGNKINKYVSMSNRKLIIIGPYSVGSNVIWFKTINTVTNKSDIKLNRIDISVIFTNGTIKKYEINDNTTLSNIMNNVISTFPVQLDCNNCDIRMITIVIKYSVDGYPYSSVPYIYRFKS